MALAHPGHAGNVQVANQPFTTTADDKPVDNRPTSFGLGMIEGGHHVIANVAGGAGYLANKVSLDNDWGDDVQHYYDSADLAGPYQGSGAGKLVGGIMAAAPAALIAAPFIPETGAGALAGMAADGAAQSALTTNAHTVGGVTKDAAIGGTLGAGFGSVAKALSSLASAPTAAATAGRGVLDAAGRVSRDGVSLAPLPAETGGMIARGIHAGAESGFLSNPILKHAIDNNLDAAAAIRDRAASSLVGGAPIKTLDEAGDAALNDAGGLGTFEQRSAEQGGKLYDQAEAFTGPTKIQTPRTLASVNALIDDADHTPGNTAGLDHLIRLRDDLTPGADQIVPSSIIDQYGNPLGHTVIPGDPAEYQIKNLRKLRTSFGDNFDAGQPAARENAKTLWGPLSDDIQAGLRAQGRGDAADAYKAADDFWAQRQQHLDDVVTPLLGSRSEQQLGSKMRAMVNSGSGDVDTFNRATSLMSPDVAGHAHASIISSLGNDSVGRFSPAIFARQWNGLADSYKASLPGHTRQDLDDLATWAGASRDAGTLVNTSKSARAISILAKLSRAGELAIGGAPVFHALALPAAGSAAADIGTGLAASSSKLARFGVAAGEIRPIAKSSAALSLLGQHVAPTLANGPYNP